MLVMLKGFLFNRMRMKLKIVHVIMCICIFFVSCKEENKSVKTIDEFVFSEVDTLHFIDSIFTSQTFYMDGWKILDSISVIHSSSDKKILYVYRYPQFTFLYSFGEIGRASGEFLTHNWSTTKESGLVALYDIMKSSLYTYSIFDGQIKAHKSYSLSQYEDGFCRPYTKILQLNDSLFLLKEDNDETNLHYVNLNGGNVFSTYHCVLRDGMNRSYTPFNYDFDVLGDKILIVYNYLPRMELLSITPDRQIIPQLFVGDVDLDTLPKNYDSLQNVWLGICTDNDYFYCLRSDEGIEMGSNIYVVDVNGQPVKRIILDRQVNSIQMDENGRLVAYQEIDNGSLFYIYGK